MNHAGWADGVTGIGTDSNTQDLYENSIFQPGDGDFVEVIQNIALDIIYAARLILNGIALLAMLYVGYLWVSSMGSEEKQTEGKYRILLIVVGLFVINIAELIYTIITGSSYLDDDFGRKVSSISDRDPGGDFNESELNTCNYFFCPQNFWWNGSVIAIMKFFEIIMIATAVVMFTWGGFTMLFRGNDEATAKTAKMRLVYGTIALVIIGFIEALYRAIFFGGTLNVSGITEILVTVANFFLFIAGPVAIVYIIIGSYFFITSAGNEERADRGKRILLYTFFATILVILAYTVLVELVGLNLF